MNVAIYYVSSVYENSRKYGDLGLMFAVIEAGEIAAHLHLICTATKIGRPTWADGKGADRAVPRC